jgi:hypothetical protein
MADRYVRLSKPPLEPNQIGYAILPVAFAVDGPDPVPPGQTWEALGYLLDSYSDDHTPYVP